MPDNLTKSHSLLATLDCCCPLSTCRAVGWLLFNILCCLSHIKKFGAAAKMHRQAQAMLARASCIIISRQPTVFSFSVSLQFSVSFSFSVSSFSFSFEPTLCCSAALQNVMRSQKESQFSPTTLVHEQKKTLRVIRSCQVIGLNARAGANLKFLASKATHSPTRKKVQI